MTFTTYIQLHMYILYMYTCTHVHKHKHTQTMHNLYSDYLQLCNHRQRLLLGWSQQVNESTATVGCNPTPVRPSFQFFFGLVRPAERTQLHHIK